MQHSSTADPPKVHPAHVQTSEGEQSSRPAQCAARPLRFALIGMAALAIALLGGTFAYGAVHEGRVFRGGYDLGKDLGGMNAHEARAALSLAGTGYPPGPVTLNSAG